MYKILSNQNFSIALTLILTILLSQSNIMNLFVDTILGRIVLALMLLCISFTNSQLGIAATLLVLVVVACRYSYNENFETTTPVTTPALAPSPIPQDIPKDIPQDIPQDSTETYMLDNTTDMLDNTTYSGTEGFDILGTERNLQRGKKSNTIIVNEDMRKSENVDAYDGWTNQAYFTSIS